ncbi:MazG nucleotide pyrophosphohydrolase domain-containing protein [Chlamydia sp. 17-3921]|uniref:MazG nucleotide pyrophosphohydrolase domain-containing protein n=1 Tax=Chlamydia sp. 17-3921 TaxID=2675798 RepID=UPI0019181F63|nr:MazG nucleotide pyrophosphohydrolase domain-containing protein [Chlamydia sp. 17-3921]
MEDKIFSSLISTVRSMALEGRCPWTQGQSLISIVEHIIGECREFSEAVMEAKSVKEVASEAGDVLTLTLLLCFLLEREGLCSVETSVEEALAKLRRRAPYIFEENAKPISAEEADRLWILAKDRERENKE